MRRRVVYQPIGYSRVLALLVVAAAFMWWLVATGFVVVSQQMAVRFADPVRALAAADSGLERALYLSASSAALSAAFESHESPFTDPNYFYRVAWKHNFVTTITATGVSGTTKRVVQVRY